MKRSIFLLSLIFVLLNTTNCNTPDYLLAPNTTANKFEVYAINSRTANNGRYTEWCDSDNITIFHTEAESDNYICDGEFTITDTTQGKFAGTLAEEVTPEKIYDWYAFYPHYAEYTQFGVDATYTIGCTATDGIQIQNGNNNSEHIAGENLPLVGVAKSVEGSTKPSFSMQNIASVAKVMVKNCLDKPITIKSIEITAAGHHLVGKFSITPTADAILCAPIADQTFNTATLIVENGEEIAAGADQMTVGIDTAIKSLQTGDGAEGDDRAFLLEHREVAVDGAETEIGDLGFQLGEHPIRSGMRIRAADAV